MPTSPEQVRSGLTIVTAAASAELANAATNAPVEQAASVLFQVTPLIVSAYTPAAATLGTDWYEELREDAQVASPFTPRAVTPLREDYLAAAVAEVTATMRQAEADIAAEIDQAVADLMLVVEEEVAAALRDTVTENTEADPDSVGWRRFARPEACKFCLMLAAKGAVYTADTARFAAHGALMGGKRTGGNCMCIAGPEFGGQDIWAEATPMQYLASKKTRTPEQRAKLRDYLTENFPDAPG